MYLHSLLIVAGGLAIGGMDADVDSDARRFDSYTRAYQAAADVKKPLLVILNPPAEEVSAQNAIHVDDLNADPDIAPILDDYVVAEIDTGTEHGQVVQELFDAQTLPRVVVIDEDQQWQLYRTSERLEPEEFRDVLQRYRDGQQVSQPAPASASAGWSQQYRTPGYCPNCRRF